MEKHKAIINGEVLRKVYKFGEINWYDGSKGINERKEFVENKVIWQGEIDSPLLEVNELLYIESLEVTVMILNRIRSTNGSYIYKTNYISEVIEDDITEETKIISQQKEIEWLEALKLAKENLEKRRLEKEKMKKEKNQAMVVTDNSLKWYQKIFK